jgi:Tol biopolymer transport system component
LYTVVWSPDGRYLLGVAVGARLALPQGTPTPPKPTPIVTQPTTDGSCANVAPSDLAPIVPMRDTGLRAATVALTSRPGATNQLTLAWSADGRRLAVGAQSFTVTNSKMLIYDCASGALLQTFTGDEFATGDLNGATAALLNPQWSPDGNRLLLTLNGALSGLVIVNSQSLS